MDKEFQTALANPSRLLYRNDFPHSEHTGKVWNFFEINEEYQNLKKNFSHSEKGLNEYNQILHRKTFIRHPIRDSIHAKKSVFCPLKNHKRSKRLFDYFEDNIEIDPEALAIDLERDYVDAYSQGVFAREELIKKHSKG